MEIKILDKRIGTVWPLPFQNFAYQEDACFDLYACIDEPIKLYPQQIKMIGAGIAVHIENKNLMMAIFPRSGLGAKTGLVLANLVGIIDSNYQGEIKLMLWNRNDSGENAILINPGDKVMQACFIPIEKPVFSIVNEFSVSTTRGDKGFGSSGVSHE